MNCYSTVNARNFPKTQGSEVSVSESAQLRDAVGSIKKADAWKPHICLIKITGQSRGLFPTILVSHFADTSDRTQVGLRTDLFHHIVAIVSDYRAEHVRDIHFGI